MNCRSRASIALVPLALLQANANSANVSVLLGKGTGRFEPQVMFDAGSFLSSLVVADLNADGKPDVVTVHGDLSVLVNSGPMTPNSDNQLDLSKAKPASTTTLIAGFTLLDAPFKGGVMVPHPDFAVAAIPVSAAGTQSLQFRWPVNAPAGWKLWLQHWVVDASGLHGFSASNGLQAIGQ